MQIDLFEIPKWDIKISKFYHILHDKSIENFEKTFCKYVGAKYACSINSATNAIFLSLLNKGVNVSIPSIIPPVVCNAIITSGNKIEFIDDVSWVGDSYVLHDFGDYKIIDSAQKVNKNQFIEEANDQDLMIFSFYPTKPVGGIDGGMIVSNDNSKIEWFKSAIMNGMKFSINNWEREILFPGYKMYMNSVQADFAYQSFINLGDKLEKINRNRKILNDKLNYNNKSMHLYRIYVENNIDFLNDMKKKNIICGIHYPACHAKDIYDNIKRELPLSEFEALHTVSVPFHEGLSDGNLEYIIDCILKIGYYNRNGV